MDMQKAIKAAFEKVKEVLAFLDKVKDKKLRKDKEELVVSLRVFLGTYESCLAKEEEVEDEYIDTGDVSTQDQENYDDVDAKRDNISDVYVDTTADGDQDDIYEDATSGDTVKPTAAPSPSHTTITPTSCDKLTNSITADFLEVKRDEKSMIRGSWVKRWCVIHRNIFYMYESSSDKKQKDAFELTNCVVNIRDNVTKEAKRKERCFEVKTTSGKTYEFCASDKDGVSRWKCYLEKGRSMSAGQLSIPTDNSAFSASPSHNAGKKKLTLFDKLKKKKTQDADTISSVSADDQELYVDTAGAEGPDELYMDTEAGLDAHDDDEIYNDVEEAPEAKPAVPLPPRGRMDSAAGLPLPVAPGDRNLPPPPPPSGDFDNPSVPPRTKKSARNESLPPPPPAKDDASWPSGSGTFTPKLPPIPQNQTQQRNSLPPPPVPAAENEIAANGMLEAEDEEYKDTDISELYQGMWDCPADDTNELSFKRGQIVQIISKEYDQYGWWIAKRKDKIGFVPKEYLMEAYEVR